ncbi:hypothetical protein [Paenibacillus antri]|uniref:hypothetical protein n=1 Tax=Paenibacillus antri TaxID=2582848 RepID=UPI0013050E94|nr:hypothetical protein [Paenibacillus antri]
MDVVKDWETLVSDLKQRIQSGDVSCRLLLDKAEADLKKAREKQVTLERDRHG